jgi:hypothetical protein
LCVAGREGHGRQGGVRAGVDRGQGGMRAAVAWYCCMMVGWRGTPQTRHVLLGGEPWCFLPCLTRAWRLHRGTGATCVTLPACDAHSSAHTGPRTRGVALCVPRARCVCTAAGVSTAPRDRAVVCVPV